MYYFQSPIVNLKRINLTRVLFYRKDGYLFDKEAILQYIITKKTEYAKKLKEYERQKQMEANETAEANALVEQKKLLKFINTEKNIVTTGWYLCHSISLY